MNAAFTLFIRHEGGIHAVCPVDAGPVRGGHASSDVTIGYPPFVGIFTGSGPARSPQVPSAIAPVSSGTLIIGTICGSPADPAGMTGGAVITAVNGQVVGSSGQRATSSPHLTAGPPQ